jgi:putative membrane protein
MTTFMRITAVGLFLFGVAGLGVAEDTKPGSPPFDDAVFVKEAASGGMLEVALGKIMDGKAKNPAVKAFAERMVTDHTKANEELKKAAAAAGISVPEMLSDKDQKELEHFQNYKGVDIDTAYMKHMLKDHEQDVALFTQASKEAKNPSIKDFAAKTLPVIQEHLKLAKKTAGQE